jgi:hypothetical protein
VRKIIPCNPFFICLENFFLKKVCARVWMECVCVCKIIYDAKAFGISDRSSDPVP